MEIIEFYSTEDKAHWLSKIKECDWDAGQYLHDLLQNDGLEKLVGEGARLLMLTDGGNLISFCTLAPFDDVQPTDLSPWIGWIYTFPRYRGHRYAGRLLDFAEKLARGEGHEAVYISTNHIGLYEKYGYELFGIMKDIGGEDTRVYVKHL